MRHLFFPGQLLDYLRLDQGNLGGKKQKSATGGRVYRRLASTAEFRRSSSRGASTRMEFSVIPYGESCHARKRILRGHVQRVYRGISSGTRHSPSCYVTRNITVKAYLKIGKYFFVSPVKRNFTNTRARARARVRVK